MAQEYDEADVKQAVEEVKALCQEGMKQTESRHFQAAACSFETGLARLLLLDKLRPSIMKLRAGAGIWGGLRRQVPNFTRGPKGQPRDPMDLRNPTPPPPAHPKASKRPPKVYKWPHQGSNGPTGLPLCAQACRGQKQPCRGQELGWVPRFWGYFFVRRKEGRGTA